MAQAAEGPGPSPAADGVPALAELAVQFWKLCEGYGYRLAQGESNAGEEAMLRHARSRLGAILAGAGLELKQYDGAAWAGTLPPVAINAEELAGAAARVGRTLEPTVLLRGEVLSPGRVMLEQV